MWKVSRKNIRGCRRRENAGTTANAKDKTRYKTCERGKPTLTTSIVEHATKTVGIDQGKEEIPPKKSNSVPIFTDASIGKIISKIEKNIF